MADQRMERDNFRAWKMQLFKKTAVTLGTAFRTLMPTCRQVARIQSDALDQALPPATRFGLWLHLQVCKWCRRYGEQIRFLSRAAHNHPDKLIEAAPQTLSSEARERIKRSLRAAGE
jgi:hypothetical protein